MNVQHQERAVYEEMWGGVSLYGQDSPGVRHLDLFVAMSEATDGTVLDIGCGTGRAGLALSQRGFSVTLADLTDVGLDEAVRSSVLPFVKASVWDDLGPVAYLNSLARLETPRLWFDWVICCDVMEHLPTEFTMLAVRRMIEVARHGVFMTISTLPDMFGVFVGRPLHQTVQPYTWWRERLATIGDITESRDLLNCGVYLVKGEAA